MRVRLRSRLLGRHRAQGLRRHRRPRSRHWRLPLTLALLCCYLLTDSLTWTVGGIDVPQEPKLPQSSTLYYADGATVLARVGVTDRSDIPLSQVPVTMRHAVLAAEDRGFYDHRGISVRGLGRAVWANLSRGGSEGASTVTQQYVKNAYLTQDQTVARKLREIVLSLKVERKFTKDGILERYLNTIYFGRGAYGVQAAAAAYFGIPARDLTLEQSAVLAAVIKDPTGFDPQNDRAEAEGRWSWILGAMAAAGWAPTTHGGYPAVLGPTGRPAQLSGAIGLIVDQVEAELQRRGIRPQQFRSGGLRIVTTIDARTQRVVEQAVRGSVPGPQRAAVVVTAPGTGEIRGYYGGSAGSGYFDEADAPHQPGGAFAPVVATAAARAGFGPDSVWEGSSPHTFASRGVPLHNRYDENCPRCPLAKGARLGLATAMYAVTDRIGAAKVAEMAHALGVAATYQGKPTLVDAAGEPTPGRTRAEIGTGRYPVSPTDLADVYATIAARGRHVERHFVDSVTTSAGVPVLRTAATVRQVPGLPVREHLDGDWASGPYGGDVRWRDTAGSAEVWAAGYACGLATVVWVGGADNKALTGSDPGGVPFTIWGAVNESQPDCGWFPGSPRPTVFGPDSH